MNEMTQRSCLGCGAPIVEGSRFCPSCGRPLAASPAAIPVLGPLTSASIAVPSRERTSPVLIVAVILTGLAAIGLVGYAVAQSGLTPLAVVSSPTPKPTPTYTLTPVETPDPVFVEPTPAAGLNLTAKLGEKVPLVTTDSGAALGSVSVTKATKYTKLDYLTADPGKMFVGAFVRYDATNGFDYNPFDWVAHDAAGAQYEYEGYNKDPELGSGTLAAGRHKEGWISFQVPKTTAHLWIDFQNGDGSVIFTVKLF